jgi:hypothetical protein
MTLRLLLAFTLTAALSGVAQADAPVRAQKSPVSATAVNALKTMRRIERERAHGTKLEDIKMPEATETLDFMIESLEKARASHAPPKRDYKSPYAPGEEAPPADLAERIDNPNHPTFKKELAFMDTMLERGKQLKRDGIPYQAFVEYSTRGWNRAMSLKLDPRENHGDNARLEREVSLDPDAKPVGWWKSWNDMTEHAVWIPTHKALGFADFNRLSSHRVRFIGLTAETVWGDNGWWSPSQFTLHDVLHGHALTSPSKATTTRFHKAIAQVKDPEVRHLLELNWFGNTHEAGGFKYEELDAEVKKYAPQKLAAAKNWLAAYRDKEFAPQVEATNHAYESAHANALKSNPAAAEMMEILWERIGGDRVSGAGYRKFVRKLPNVAWFGDIGDFFHYEHYNEISACKYAPGCTELVVNAFKAIKQIGNTASDLPTENPSTSEDEQ